MKVLKHIVKIDDRSRAAAKITETHSYQNKRNGVYALDLNSRIKREDLMRMEILIMKNYENGILGTSHTKQLV
ncbi:hypothetical protein [Metabacillus fastidiosus]|uniref:Uncharacterized protein n=1 Tax=Metabacillus fastidiosus TaxID=1458 RepID=A0ABU6NZY0_9BACI|nr:hypothetical protein [Metabacillus fastidiosus]MED4402687.1 hypothetical protein [Metabacillus fastidiosus]